MTFLQIVTPQTGFYLALNHTLSPYYLSATSGQLLDQRRRQAGRGVSYSGGEWRRRSRPLAVVPAQTPMSVGSSIAYMKHGTIT